MLLKYIKKSVTWANSKDSGELEQPFEAIKVDVKVGDVADKSPDKAAEPIVVEYRAAAIAARAADARFAAAESRVAAARAAADEDYSGAAAVASLTASEAISAAKTRGEDIQRYGESIEEAESEYRAAIEHKSAAEERAKAAEESLKDDIELAALAYVLAEEDTVEKEIAMTLLEENEIKVVAKKYELEAGYTRVIYKKEKQAVSLAEEDVKVLQEMHDSTEIEAEEARLQAEKMANYIAEYEEHKEVGLVDKRYKEVASEAHKALQTATIKSIEADKELEKITQKLLVEKEEAAEIKEHSEIYQEVQGRIVDPLKKAEKAKAKGLTLPPLYEHDISDVAAKVVIEADMLTAQAKEELEAIQRAAKKQAKLGAIKASCGAALLGVIISFFVIGTQGYFVLGVVLILGLYLLNAGIRDHYNAVKVCHDKDISLEGLSPEDMAKLREKSLTQSLSKSLLQSIISAKSKAFNDKN